MAKAKRKIDKRLEARQQSFDNLSVTQRQKLHMTKRPGSRKKIN